MFTTAFEVQAGLLALVIKLFNINFLVLLFWSQVLFQELAMDELSLQAVVVAQ